MDSTSTLLPTGPRPGTTFATPRSPTALTRRLAIGADADTRLSILRRGETCALALPAGATLELLSGRVWLTLDGLLDDVFLDAGTRWAAPHAGRCVIEGDGPVPAQLRLQPRP